MSTPAETGFVGTPPKKKSPTEQLNSFSNLSSRHADLQTQADQLRLQLVAEANRIFLEQFLNGKSDPWAGMKELTPDDLPTLQAIHPFLDWSYQTRLISAFDAMRRQHRGTDIGSIANEIGGKLAIARNLPMREGDIVTGGNLITGTV